MITVRCLAFLAIAATALSAYELFIPDRQYRSCFPGQPYCPSAEIVAKLGATTPPKSLPAVECQNRGQQQAVVNCPDAVYRLAYVEYRDSGERWDNVELEAAKLLIEESRRASRPDVRDGGPIHLIAFFHGWANNANESSNPVQHPRDVEKFRAYLVDYESHLKAGHTPVVGVFFGWHGRSLDLDYGLHFPSFWTRSAAARRVGLSPTLQSDFQCLTELATRRGAVPRHSACESATYPQGIEGARLGPPATRSRVIVLAHSFGARLLENALLGAIPTSGDVQQTCKILVDERPARPPVDLIVFENAATGARLIWRQYLNCQPCGNSAAGCHDVSSQPPFDFSKSVMVRSFAYDSGSYDEVCRQHPQNPECQPYPLLLSISGQKDFLTRGLLALAAGQHPAAFLPWLQTHKVKRVTGADAKRQPDPSRDEVVGFDSCKTQLNQGQTCSPADVISYMVERKRLTRNLFDAVVRTNPIWTMSVPKHVISNHGDVWNPGYLNLQLNLIALHNPDEAEKQSTFRNGKVPIQ